MKKRFVFYSILLIILIITLSLLYKHYKPQEADVEDKDKITYHIEKECDFDEFALYLNNSDSNLFVCIYDENDFNSQYLLNVSLQTIKDNYTLKKSLDDIYFINAANISNDELLSYKNRFGFKSIPCLINLRYKEGKAEIINIVQNSSSNIELASLINWLKENNYLD